MSFGIQKTHIGCDYAKARVHCLSPRVRGAWTGHSALEKSFKPPDLTNVSRYWCANDSLDPLLFEELKGLSVFQSGIMKFTFLVSNMTRHKSTKRSRRKLSERSKDQEIFYLATLF